MNLEKHKTNSDFSPLVFIIILNWNGYEDTRECISSVLKITYPNYKILLVDNGSDKKEYERITSLDFAAEIIRSEQNLGFSGGNNLGIKYALNAGADYLLLLNNDTIVESNFLEPLLKTFEEERKVGIVAPQINYFNEPKKIWSAGGKISWLRGSGFAYSDEYEDGIEKDDMPAGFVSGCCMLAKKEIFETVGLFDDNFFLYVEDVDLCYRTTYAGYKIIVSNNSKIFHKISSSTIGDLSKLPLYYVTRNRLYFSKKNFQDTFLITFFYITVSMILKGFVWILQRKSENIIVVIKAFKDFFKGNMGKTDHNSLKII
jgi:GT2 family glycosyltransferase